MRLGKAFDNLLYILSLSILIYSIVISLMPEPLYTRGWLLLTSMGSSTVYIAIGLLIYFLDDPGKAYKAVVALVLSGWLNLVLKILISLPRPENPRIEVGGYAFPSGHAQSSTTFWSSIAILYRRIPVTVFSATLIGVIGYSRIALNVHYPLDILGGFGIGLTLTILLTVVLLERLETAKYIWSILFHIISAALLCLTYLYYPEAIFLRFGGFLLGLSLHPLLYRGPEMDEEFFRRIGKFIASFTLVTILFRIGSGPIDILFLSVLTGVSIPLIRFKI